MNMIIFPAATVYPPIQLNTSEPPVLHVASLMIMFLYNCSMQDLF